MGFSLWPAVANILAKCFSIKTIGLVVGTFLLSTGLSGLTAQTPLTDVKATAPKGEGFQLVAGQFNPANSEFPVVARPTQMKASLSGTTEQDLNLVDKKLKPLDRNTLDFTYVPFDTEGRALMVDATLNNNVEGRFIIDTGATYTSITPEIAEELGIDWQNAPKVKITTANGRIYVSKVVIKSVKINGLEAKDVKATVIPVREGSTFKGLLGLSFIRKFRTTIDPSAGYVIFETNATLANAG